MSAPALLASSAAFPSANTSTLSLGLGLGSRGRETRPLGMVEPLGIAVFTVSSYVAVGEPTSTDYATMIRMDADGHKSQTYSQDMYRIQKCHFLRVVDACLCSFFQRPRLAGGARCLLYLTGEDGMAGGEATGGK